MSNEYKDWIEDMKNSEWDSEEHNQYLYMTYPFIRDRATETECYTHMSDMPIGWKKSFGINFLNDIRVEYEKMSNLEKLAFHITCIKEKFGELRVYATYHFEDIDRIIEKYRKLSRITCCNCGAPATRITTDWISPFCDSCIPKRKNGKEYDNINIEEYWKEWDNLCQL